jgi:hypothetical protein
MEKENSYPEWVKELACVESKLQGMYQESDEFTSTTALNVRKDFVWGKSRQ